MRRALFALLTGGVLLTTTACGTAPGSPSTNAAASPGPAAAASSAVGASCEALAQVYTENMAPYAQSLTTLVADPKAAAQAQKALATFATAVQDATKASEDAALKAAGEQTAKQMKAKSADAKFFGAIKTPEDVTTAMGPTLTEWLSPVARHCS
jgi:hypothetical protein